MTLSLEKSRGGITRLFIPALLTLLLFSCGQAPGTPVPADNTVTPAENTLAPTLYPPTLAPNTPTPSRIPPTATATITSTPAPTSVPPTATAAPKSIACKFTINANTRVADGSSDFAAVKPGDTVCLAAGNRTGLKLVNFKGTEQAPVVFINSGGKVVIDAAKNNGDIGIQLYGSQHIRITGSGDAATRYGIEIANGANAAVDTNRAGSGGPTDGTEYVEFDHIYAHDIGAGFRTGKDNDLLNSQVNWSGHHYYIHDNYIKTTLNEAMYIGSSDTGGTFPIYDVQVWNNRVEDAGYDGIQVRQAHTTVLVHDNYIDGTGRDPCKNSTIDNTAGFNIARGTDTGDWYNNTIISARTGFYLNGSSNVRIYNNLVIDSGHATSDLKNPDCPPGVSSTSPEGGVQIINAENVQFLFNTVVNPGVQAAYGMRLKNSTGEVHDNIVGGSFGSLIEGKGMTLSHNLTNTDLAFFKFADVGKQDFHLAPTSPAVHAAGGSTPPGVDMEGIRRSQTSPADVGALEHR